jgi:hypothetical protein
LPPSLLSPRGIAQAVWLYFRFPLSLRMVEEMLAARGVDVAYETIRRWAEKFGRDFAGATRCRASQRSDKWHMDEVLISITGKKTLAVARRGPEQRCPRRSRATSPRQENPKTLDAHAVEEDPARRASSSRTSSLPTAPQRTTCY